MNLPSLADSLADNTQWQGSRCPRCNCWHAQGEPCPALRGMRIIIEHLPCCGWRGSLCLPTTGGDLMVRREIPSGLIQQVARGRDSGAVSGIDGEVGFLPLIMAFAGTPQGQNAMKGLAAVATGGTSLMVPGMMPGGGSGGGAAPASPMGGAGAGMMGMFGSMLGSKMGGGAPAAPGATQGVQGPQSVSTRALFAALPDNLPPMPALPQRRLGESFGELPGDFLRQIGPGASSELSRLSSDVPEPHALLHRLPSLFGGHSLIRQGEHMVDTWPEFAAFADVLGLVSRIIDAEAGRLLGDEEAEEALRTAIESRSAKVRAALEMAQNILG